MKDQGELTQEDSQEGTEAVSEADYPSSARRFRDDSLMADSSRESTDEWVTTYMDLITLLLTLFIVLLAYADKGTGEYEEVTKTIAEVTQGIFEESAAPIQLEPVSLLDSMQADLQKQFADSGLSSGITVERSEGAIDIQISEKVLFGSGEAHFNLNAQRALKPVLRVLQETDYKISVAGHTDNIPIYTEYYPSNWELSTSRATSVVRHLIEKGISANRLRAIGYADTIPLAENDTEEGRRKNRRVTIIITQNEP